LIGRPGFDYSKIVIMRKKGVLLFSQLENGFAKHYTPTKPPYNSYMNLEECEDLGYRVFQMRNRFNDMGDSVLKNVDLADSQEILKREIEDKLYQKIERLQNSMEFMLLHTLDERFPKSDIVTQGNHENKEEKNVQPQSHMGNILTISRT
jgi:hypothetical protein